MLDVTGVPIVEEDALTGALPRLPPAPPRHAPHSAAICLAVPVCQAALPVAGGLPGFKLAVAHCTGAFP